MRGAHSLYSRELGFAKLVWVLVVLCALAIASSAQTLDWVTSFTGVANGSNPTAPVVQGNDGNLYGTALFGGPNGALCNNPSVGCGTLYKVTPSGTLTVLHNFCSQSNCSDGFFPQAGLTQATDGSLYGATAGTHDPITLTVKGGTIFKITFGGTLTTLYRFCPSGSNCTNGSEPTGGVIQASDGNFYGTTFRGGTSSNCPSSALGCGTVFKITPQGSLTTLYSFCSQAGCADGSLPIAGLVQGSDGNLYGTTSSGGTGCAINQRLCGTIFKITPGGTFTSLHSFTNADDTGNPFAALIEGVDGNFYGTASGPPGTVFRMSPAGSLTVLSTFANGVNSDAALTQAADGNFYGTTLGTSSTIFKMTLSGTLTSVYLFCSQMHCDDGDQPHAAVTAGVDGNLYGTTYGGGVGGSGTVFRFAGPAAAAVQFGALPPCRLVDTRQGGHPIQGGTWQTYVVPQLGNCNVPVSATAYSLNVTVVPQAHHPLNYLTIWAAGRPQPYVSTMNSPDGRTKANAALVPAGGNGAVSVFVTNTSDVIVDVNGYFSTAQNTYQFYPLAPCRVVDTRTGSNQPQGLGPPRLEGREVRDLPILSSPCLQGVINPQAYAFNVTAVPNPDRHPLAYLTLWPSNQQQPVVSTLNNPTGTVVANAAIVPASPDGDVSVYAEDTTDLIMDITGYFAARSQSGLSFHATAPCRSYDSRNGGGQFQGTRVVDIHGSPCAPPADAGAYVFNATVVPPGRMPFLTLWPDGQDMPVVSTLNAYDGLVTSNAAIVPNGNGSIDAYADALTNLILDISGYFAQ